MSRLFGTDGIRGITNEKITTPLALNLGRAFGIVLDEIEAKQVLIGYDTRKSCDMLRFSLCAGLNCMGVNVIDVGVVPTPALSFLCGKHKCFGIMITASHNPSEFNGFKFMDDKGYKISLELQDKIEKTLMNIDSYLDCKADDIGTTQKEDYLIEWANHLKETVDIDLSGYKIALDCANGAGYAVAPYIFKLLGAEVVAFCNDYHKPINCECGSEYPQNFAKLCVKSKIDIGFCYDGDADRVVVVDKEGKIYNGADIIYIFANYLSKTGQLKEKIIVSTIITNCGLENSLLKSSIKMLRCPVGGRYIQEQMRAKNLSFGAEESGHFMLSNLGVEADGIGASLYLIKILQENNFDLSALTQGLQKTLVTKLDIPVSARQKQIVERGGVDDFVEEVQNQSLANGRLIVRPSGTEDIIRVLVEGENMNILKKIEDLVKTHITSL